MQMDVSEDPVRSRVFTVMSTCVLSMHPLPSVAVRVYTVLIAGEASGEALVAELNPVAGVHTYDDNPAGATMLTESA